MVRHKVSLEEARRIKAFWSEWGQLFASSLQKKYADQLWQEYVENAD